jgi:hypothetical protein
MMWGREVLELHLVLLRILTALVQVKAEKSGMIRIDQHLPHQQPPMEEEPFILVVLVHLMLEVEVFTNSNKLLRNGRGYNQVEFTSQFHAL